MLKLRYQNGANPTCTCIVKASNTRRKSIAISTVATYMHAWANHIIIGRAAHTCHLLERGRPLTPPAM